MKPTLGPLWAAWLVLGGHWRAVTTAAAGIMALVGISLIVVGPAALVDYPAHLVGVSGQGALGVHPEEMVNWRGAAVRLGAGDWLQWAGTALTLALVAWTWWRTSSRQLAAAAALLATPLVIPHANQHEAILGGVGVLLVLVAARELLPGRTLTTAAIGSHAILWAGPALGGEAAAWLLFSALVAWLCVTAWLATSERAEA
jgi:hypothetical protein